MLLKASLDRRASRRTVLIGALLSLAGCTAPAPPIPTPAPATASPVPTVLPAATATAAEPTATATATAEATATPLPAVPTLPLPSPLAGSPAPSPSPVASPGASPSPSPVALEPTAVPTAPITVRPSPGAVASPGPRLLLADDFRDLRSGFPSGQAPGGVGEHGYDTTIGEYWIKLLKAPGFDAESSFWDAVVDVYDTFEDFRLEIEARQVGFSANGAWGVIFRVQDFANYYKFAIDPNSGQYEFFKLVKDQRTDFIPWRPTAAIRRGPQANRLTLIANGQQLSIRVNDIPVASHTDDALKSGRIGMIANVWSEPLEYRFRNLSLWTP